MPFGELSKKAVKPAVVGVGVLLCVFMVYSLLEHRRQSLALVSKADGPQRREIAIRNLLNEPKDVGRRNKEAVNSNGNQESNGRQNLVESGGGYWKSNDDDDDDENNELSDSQTPPGHNVDGKKIVKGSGRAEQQAAEVKQKRAPDFIVIGVRKGGTRALLNMIELHPKIVSAGKEVHYFDKPENYKQGLKWYIDKMMPSSKGQLTGEKTPAYFVRPGVPQRMMKYFNSVHKHPKILLVVREPVSRVVSDFTQGLYNSKKDQQHFNAEKIKSRFRKLALNRNGEVNRKWQAITVSEYSVHLRQWWNVFKRDQLHIVNGDDLIANPKKEMVKVASFLHLDKSFDWNSVLHHNETRGFYCLGEEGSSYCLASSKGRPHPEVEESVLAKLRQYYKPFNAKFVEMTGLDVDWDT